MKKEYKDFVEGFNKMPHVVFKSISTKNNTFEIKFDICYKIERVLNFVEYMINNDDPNLKNVGKWKADFDNSCEFGFRLYLEPYYNIKQHKQYVLDSLNAFTHNINYTVDNYLIYLDEYEGLFVLVDNKEEFLKSREEDFMEDDDGYEEEEYYDDDEDDEIITIENGK